MHWAYPEFLWLSLVAAGIAVLVDVGRVRRQRAVRRLAITRDETSVVGEALGKELEDGALGDSGRAPGHRRGGATMGTGGS